MWKYQMVCGVTLHTQTRLRQEVPRTPADDRVPVEISPLWEESFHQQSEEVQPLDEQPEVVGHDTVVKKHHHCFTFHLKSIKKNKVISTLPHPDRKKCF